MKEQAIERRMYRRPRPFIDLINKGLLELSLVASAHDFDLVSLVSVVFCTLLCRLKTPVVLGR